MCDPVVFYHLILLINVQYVLEGYQGLEIHIVRRVIVYICSRNCVFKRAFERAFERALAAHRAVAAPRRRRQMDAEDDARWWARLVPTCDVSRECAHVDRAALTRDDAGNLVTLANDAPLRGPEIKLRLKSCVLGRVVMNKEGTARAKSQPADVALDVPSGAWC